MAERRTTTRELPHDPFHRPPGHERQIDRDIDVRKISWTVIGILVLTLVSMAAMWGLLVYLQSRAERTAPDVPALHLQAAEEPPPGPRLQATPERDLLRMRAEETEVLTTYGWSDREAGTVRVPIDRAMEMLAAERGAGTPAGATATVEGETGPGLGRPAEAPTVARPIGRPVDVEPDAIDDLEPVGTVPRDEAETPGEAGPGE